MPALTTGGRPPGCSFTFCETLDRSRDCHQRCRLVPVAYRREFPEYVSDLATTGDFLVPYSGPPGHDTLHHTLFQQVLNSRQRWAWSTFASLATYLLYVLGFVIVIQTGRGLRGVAFIFVGQQVLASALVIPVALRYLDRRGIGLMAWSKLRSIMSFSGKMQVSGVAALVISEVDSLVIGGALSVRALGIYSPGANFANQLSSVATNALGPASVHLRTSTGAPVRKALSGSSSGSSGCGS